MRSVILFLLLSPCWAQNSYLEGIIHDPQHRPVPAAEIVVHKDSSARSTRSDENGRFRFDNLAPGTYQVMVSAGGFEPLSTTLPVVAGKSPVAHLQLRIAGVSQTVEVSGAASKLQAQTSTVETLVTPEEVARTPGADQANSLAMITDFTPGAYMVHDMLHMRGGHQVNWFMDGIPLVNTNIASNVAPLISPKNIDELQVERGGYSGEYGDRTYGVLNVVTPSGFERNNEANLILSAGNYYSTDDQFDIGGHTQRFAWFASLDGNRSQLGLMTPVPQVIHDQDSGGGGLLSLLFNPNSRDQVRWLASVRADHYQVPSSQDLQLESDTLLGFHWTHSFADGVLFSLAPNFHYNVAHYEGAPSDMPFALNDNGRSAYFGARAVVQAQRGGHNARAGVDTWEQHDQSLFSLAANPGGQTIAQRERAWANSTAFFMEDQYKVRPWLTLDLGLRLTHYQGLLAENAADPRVGGAIRIPKTRWILHGYYAYYYQPPPLDSLSGPALNFAIAQGYGFIPLKGERDIQHDVGLSIPWRGWTLDTDQFHTSARNFLDHDVIGNSGIFVPLTDLAAIVSGTEISVRSPRLARRATLRLAYSHQTAKAAGPVNGGLLEFSEPGFFLLDHDQRDTLSTVAALNLPLRAWLTAAWQYGSGFLNGNGPAHLPPHNTFDISAGKSFGEAWQISAAAVNVANTRYLLDTSNTFGGTHYVNPRQIYGELRYRFHF